MYHAHFFVVLLCMWDEPRRKDAEGCGGGSTGQRTKEAARTLREQAEALVRLAGGLVLQL